MTPTTNQKDGIHDVLKVFEVGLHTIFNSTSEAGFVFVREMNGFRTVDYEAIAMLDVSATQELHRQLAAKSEEIPERQQRLGALKAKDKARDEKSAKLERSLEDASKVIPVSFLK